LKLTIVIPTYNEVENLPKLIPALFDLSLPELNILVVDDGSPDGTGQIADELASHQPKRLQVMHREGKMGLGSAYIQGFQYALKHGAQAVGQMDADFSHPVAKVIELVQALERADIAVGSRYIPGGSLDENWPFWRKGLSTWGNFYSRSILRIPLHDMTGGFRLWRQNVLTSMPLERIRSNGYIFQVEMAYVAHRLGFKFFEVPIHFADRRWGKSKMSVRIQIEAAIRVWQLPLIYRDLRPRQA